MFMALTPLPEEAARELVAEFLSVVHVDMLRGYHKFNTVFHTSPHCTLYYWIPVETEYHCASLLGQDWSSRHRYTSRMPWNHEIKNGRGDFSISIGRRENIVFRNPFSLEGHLEWVLVDFEISILIVTILWFFFCVFYTIKMEAVQNLNLIGPLVSEIWIFKLILLNM